MFKVIDITSNRVLFTGTEGACKTFKRNNYNRFSRVYPV